jgi:hypothetical protein
MIRPWIGPWHGAGACPACGCWDMASGPHAVACDLNQQLEQYRLDCLTGRVNEPGYWMTMDELEAKYPAASARARGCGAE